MFCKKCGNELEAGSAFCKKCGTSVEYIEKKKTADIFIGTRFVKVGIIAVSLLMVLATVLPFFRIDSALARFVGYSSISLFRAGEQLGDGIFYIIFAVLIILFVCLNKRIPVLIFGVLSFLVWCADMAELKQRIGEMQRELGRFADVYDFISKGAGYYLITISVIALVALCIFCFFIMKAGAGKPKLQS